MSIRALIGLSLVASAFAFSLDAGAANDPERIYDAVSSYEALSREAYRGGFTLNGILRGQSAGQTSNYVYGDSDQAAAKSSCERFALIAMKDAGHYAFVVRYQSGAILNPSGAPADYVVACRLERR
jgi:hypothetical protein